MIEPAARAKRFESIRRKFGERLANRRGLRPSTVDAYDYWVMNFLDRALGRRKTLRSLTTAMFDSYIKFRRRELAAATLRTAIHCIGAFLLFCFERGLLVERVDVIDYDHRTARLCAILCDV